MSVANPGEAPPLGNRKRRPRDAREGARLTGDEQSSDGGRLMVAVSKMKPEVCEHRVVPARERLQVRGEAVRGEPANRS